MRFPTNQLISIHRKEIIMSWPDFKSFTITFKNQNEFNSFVEIQESFNIIDIGWSDRIVNFEDEEERQKAINLLTGEIFAMQKENLVFGE